MTTLHPAWMDWPETQTLVEAFGLQKVPLRFVGGAVRDALLERTVTDVDAATPLLPGEITTVLVKSGIKAVPTGADHGTITAVIDGKPFEITTLRKDTSCDGRHAEVEYTNDWKEDAKRRDFTMNAMYMTPAGELFDYFGGEADARAGIVRFIGNPADRIKEDYLRILRFFRFHAHYGSGAPDMDALAACASLASNIDTLSGERIQHELVKLLAASHYSDTLRPMQDTKVLAATLGFALHDSDMAVFARFEQIEKLGVPIEAFVKLAGFVLHGGWEKLSVHLRLSNQVQRDVQIALAHGKHLPADLAGQKKLLRRLGPDSYRRSIAVGWAAGKEAISSKHPNNAMMKLASEWVPPEFPVSGHDLKTLGIAEGKGMGDTLRQLEEAWEKSDYTLTKEQLLSQAG